MGAPTPITTWQAVTVGGTTLRLRSDGSIEVQRIQGNLRIDIRDLVVEVPGKRLIEGASATLFPGEFVGLMGPSGAGKTTLMLAANGYMKPTCGQVLYNGKDLYRHYDEYRLHLGYVPQDDIMHGDLTVHEALYYNARLRLPADTKKAEIERRIAEVLSRLGLEGTADILIGSPTKKGISGGQRKRVNLAMELLTDPSVLFLDEPTSGLSSEDALTVMNILRRLADEGKTLLLTIHQPSREVFRQMDHLLLLARDAASDLPAGVAYFGPAYPDSIHFLNPEERSRTDPSPDRLLEGLARRPASDQIATFRASHQHKVFVADRKGSDATEDSGPKAFSRRTGGNGFLQWRALTTRSLRVKSRDAANTAILLIQAPLIAGLIAMAFGSQVADLGRGDLEFHSWQEGAAAVATVLFLSAVAALWLGCSNAAREIVAEWAIYHRERMVHLSLPAYVGSKSTVLGSLCCVQCAALAFIVHRGCHLQTPIEVFFGVLVLTSWVGMALGLLLSARSPSSEVAISLVPLALLPMVILGGILQPPHKMPVAVEAVASAMPSRWAFETLLLLESRVQPGSPVQEIPGHAPVQPTDLAERYFPADHRYDDARLVIAIPIGVLALMWVLTVLATLKVLKSRDVHP